MKKFLLLALGAIAAHTCHALPNSSILLQHNGSATVYHADDLQEALQNSVDGDTLFLSKGTYPGFTIDKQITVRGEGDNNTIVTGLINIAIPDSVTLKSTVLEGIYIQGYYHGSDDNYSIKVSTPLNNFEIRQCNFETLVFEKDMYGVQIKQCYCSKYISIPKNVHSLTAVNSKIAKVDFSPITDYYTQNSSKDISFINCNILTFRDFENFRGTLINSITGYGRIGNEVSFQSCSIINTLVCTYRLTIDNKCYQENCWTYGDTTKLINEYNLNCMYTDEELLAKGYIGNDGSVIGCNGGPTPYSLTLDVPTVTLSEVRVDNDRHVLNVNLTISNSNE